MILTDLLGKTVVQFSLFQEVNSPFGFLQLAEAQVDVPKDTLLETASTVKEKGGMPISFICDNCPLNQGTYHALGELGRAYLPALGIHVYLVYDFVHIFDNLRNNWITEPSKRADF